VSPSEETDSDDRRLWHRRLPNFEAFDKITMEVVPRYKTSYMSGDEWRTSISIRFFFKGEEVAVAGARDMQAALLLLGRYWVEHQEPIPTRVIEIEEKKCSQPGCSSDAVARLEVKRLTADDGHWLDPSEFASFRHFRRFCARHVRRGDCSREDSDDNYMPMDGVGSEASTNIEESPAAVLVVDAEAFMRKDGA
jgi:hypothetical protein